MNKLICLGASLAIVLGVTLIGTSAHAQAMFVGAGSTPQGDYLRGVGIAAWGMGQYNLNTAQAESINVDTVIKWNEYVAAVAKETNREYVAKKLSDAASVKEFYKQHRQQILDSPEAHDVLNASALNAVLERIQDPKIGESVFRSTDYQVPLPIDVVRHIPFMLGEKGQKFSMDRLTLKGKGKWTVALQDPQFQREKRAYERALDKALEQAIDGKMEIAAINELDARADDLFRRLDEVLGKRNDPLYIEAKERLTELKAIVGQLKITKIERAVGELDKYSGTTVNDLKMFMRNHNLRFAAARSREERELFPELYALLRLQADKVIPDRGPAK
jgi:hypothetical protein